MILKRVRGDAAQVSGTERWAIQPSFLYVCVPGQRIHTPAGIRGADFREKLRHGLPVRGIPEKRFRIIRKRRQVRICTSVLFSPAENIQCFRVVVRFCINTASPPRLPGRRGNNFRKSTGRFCPLCKYSGMGVILQDCRDIKHCHSLTSFAALIVPEPGAGVKYAQCCGIVTWR